MPESVLITGASGFIGAYTAAAVVRSGRTAGLTVSRPGRIDDARAGVVNLLGEDPGLDVVVANLNEDGHWPRAVQGCDAVIHVASPLPFEIPKDRQELIRPARDGALRVVRAARGAGVRRVVMTSSVAAVIGSRTDKEVFTEADWGDPEDGSVTAYNQSKTIAERAVRDDVAQHGGPELVTVNPALVVGPVARPEVNASVQIVWRLLNGLMPALPRFGYDFVDVRDVADLHVACLDRPGIDRGRFVAANGFFWLAEIAQLLRDELGGAANRVPKRTAPNVFIRALALVDPGARRIIPELGVRRTFDCRTTKETLGWRPRAVDEAILDCARSLIGHGLVKA